MLTGNSHYVFSQLELHSFFSSVIKYLMDPQDLPGNATKAVNTASCSPGSPLPFSCGSKSSLVCTLVVVVWWLSPVQCFWHQAPLSMEFSRQEYWNRLPFPSRDLPDPGIEPGSAALQADLLPFESPAKHTIYLNMSQKMLCSILRQLIFDFSWALELLVLCDFH